jgi:uncharacterized protein (DUF2336 family)
MTQSAALLPDLENIIQHHSREKRGETLSRLTTLFVEGSPRFNEEHVGLFDSVLSRLLADVDPQARSDLSSRLAPIGNAPIEVSRRLAHDDIAIAEPLLRNSTRLTEPDLIEVARTKGQEHLLAIASRAGVGEAVTDVLLERGDDAVIERLAGNHTARLSARGVAMLVERADPHGTLARTISQRPDLPPGLFVQRASTDDEVTTPALGEAEISALAKAGRRDETVAALAVLCSVPSEVIERLIGGERTDPVLILCKAAGFGWPSVEAILSLRPKGTASQSFDAIYANFERLAPATARRVLRFWQARTTA